MALLNTSRLPFVTSKVRVLSYGTGQTVFLLDTGQGQKVLKVLRLSLGSEPGAALEIARRSRRNHRQVEEWFFSHRIVVPSHYLVLHSPLLGATARAVLQPYIPGTKRDIFLDYSVEQAAQLLSGDAGLRSQWLGFVAGLFGGIDKTRRCFDLVGRENLMLVEHDGRRMFKIADFGIFDLETVRVEAPARYARLQDYLTRVRQVTEAL
jgi:hypothetical protein